MEQFVLIRTLRITTSKIISVFRNIIIDMIIRNSFRFMKMTVVQYLVKTILFKFRVVFFQTSQVVGVFDRVVEVGVGFVSMLAPEAKENDAGYHQGEENVADFYFAA